MIISKTDQKKFINLTKNQFTVIEFDWILSKTAILNTPEGSTKFNLFFSLVSRFISNTTCIWENQKNNLTYLGLIYPGFNKSTWSKQELARVFLMIHLNKHSNKSLLLNCFETAEIKEQIALYKGLYLLENASDFSHQVTEGIRTNVITIFNAIAYGNPYIKTYLNQDAWNQLILKCFFMDSGINNIQYLDEGKNKKLADMLQDYVKERWAAGREVSPQIWRMIEGYLKQDIKTIINNRTSIGLEKEILENLKSQTFSFTPKYWDSI